MVYRDTFINFNFNFFYNLVSHYLYFYNTNTNTLYFKSNALQKCHPSLFSEKANYIYIYIEIYFFSTHFIKYLYNDFFLNSIKFSHIFYFQYK